MNSAVLRIAARSAEKNALVDAVSILQIRGIPFFDGDVEALGDPPAVVSAKEIVDAADGLLIATPEYNAAPPGVLKNAIDWLSRPWGDSALTGKPVATMSAAPGPGGARKAQVALREILAELGADVIPHDLLTLSAADSRVAPRIDALVSELAVACGPRRPASRVHQDLEEQSGVTR